jgi:hypothetical protein
LDANGSGYGSKEDFYEILQQNTAQSEQLNRYTKQLYSSYKEHYAVNLNNIHLVKRGSENYAIHIG